MAKASTEDYRQLKITDIAKYPTGSVITARWTRGGIEQAAVRSYRATENRLILDYRINGEARTYPVKLLHTPCNYGGSRLWFECPQCRHRVGVLYSGRVFVCRHCKNLNYPSTRQPAAYNAIDKARRLLAKINPLDTGIPRRPKGMHHQTYERIYRQWLAAEEKADELVSKKLGILGRRLDNLKPQTAAKK